MAEREPPRSDRKRKPVDGDANLSSSSNPVGHHVPESVAESRRVRRRHDEVVEALRQLQRVKVKHGIRICRQISKAIRRNGDRDISADAGVMVPGIDFIEVVCVDEIMLLAGGSRAREHEILREDATNAVKVPCDGGLWEQLLAVWASASALMQWQKARSTVVLWRPNHDLSYNYYEVTTAEWISATKAMTCRLQTVPAKPTFWTPLIQSLDFEPMVNRHVALPDLRREWMGPGLGVRLLCRYMLYLIQRSVLHKHPLVAVQPMMSGHVVDFRTHATGLDLRRVFEPADDCILTVLCFDWFGEIENNKVFHYIPTIALAQTIRTLKIPFVSMRAYKEFFIHVLVGKRICIPDDAMIRVCQFLRSFNRRMLGAILPDQNDPFPGSRILYDGAVMPKQLDAGVTRPGDFEAFSDLLAHAMGCPARWSHFISKAFFMERFGEVPDCEFSGFRFE